MIKAFIALCLILVASAGTINSYTPGEFANLFQGFNDKLNIENDNDFDKCAKVPLIPDIQKIFTDLNVPKPNPFQLVADVMALYNDYNGVKANCPELAQTYEAFFSKFYQAVQTDPSHTLLQVLENILANFPGIQGAVVQAIQDFGSQNYYNAGEDIGTVVGYALAGYI